MKKRYKALLAAMLTGALAAGCLAGCGKMDGTAGGKMKKVTLNEVAHSIFYAPQYAAIELGYFEEEGIDLTLVNGAGADKVMTALISGDAQIGFMGSEASIYVSQEGADDPAVNFAQLTQRAGNFLVGRTAQPDFKWEDLKGKKVLGGRAGGMTPRVPLHLVDNDRVHGTPVRGIMQDYEFSEETLEYICRHDMMHSDFTGRLNHRLGDIRKSGTKVFFDLGNNLKHPDLEEVIQNIDCGLVSFGNDFEEGKAFLKYAHSKGVKLMIATFGKLGSIAYDGSTFYKGEIVPVEHVVNTVGAGDSYFAGFISGIIDGKSIQECMRRGAEQSAKVISTFNPYL